MLTVDEIRKIEDVKERAKQATTALHRASATFYSMTRDPDLCKNLLELKAEFYDGRNFALSLAARPNCMNNVKVLIANKCDVNFETMNKSRVLDMAVYSNWPDLVRFLVKANADIHAQNVWGETAFDSVQSNSITSYLIKQGVECTTWNTNALIRHLTHGNSDPDIPLDCAHRHNYVYCSLEGHANPFEKDKYGTTLEMVIKSDLEAGFPNHRFFRPCMVCWNALKPILAHGENVYKEFLDHYEYEKTQPWFGPRSFSNSLREYYMFDCRVL